MLPLSVRSHAADCRLPTTRSRHEQLTTTSVVVARQDERLTLLSRRVLEVSEQLGKLARRRLVVRVDGTNAEPRSAHSSLRQLAGNVLEVLDAELSVREQGPQRRLLHDHVGATDDDEHALALADLVDQDAHHVDVA